MNVGNPSNLARLFDLFDGALDKNGITHQVPDMENLRTILKSYSITDEETVACIQTQYTQYNRLLEPHGAVGWVALERFQFENPQAQAQMVLLETAHPAKFAEVIEKELHFSPPMPATLQAIFEKEEKQIRIENDFHSFKQQLRSILS
jgi:threonine synthase